MNTNLTAVNLAVETLYNEGRKHYTNPETANKWESVGLAIASVEDDGNNFARLAYAALEDHNRHRQNSALAFAFLGVLSGNEYNGQEYDISTAELEDLKRLFNREVKGVDFAGNVTIKRYRVALTVEVIEDPEPIPAPSPV